MRGARRSVGVGRVVQSLPLVRALRSHWFAWAHTGSRLVLRGAQQGLTAALHCRRLSVCLTLLAQVM